MSTMLIADHGFVRKPFDVFNKIAMFSVSGLSVSMMLFFVYDFRMVNPWF
jgi:hypothetical protein